MKTIKPNKKDEQKAILRDFFYCGVIAYLLGGLIGFPLSFLLGNLTFFFIIPVLSVFGLTAPLYYYVCIYYPQRETIEQRAKLQELKDDEYNEQLRLFTPLEQELDDEMDRDAVPYPANVVHQHADPVSAEVSHEVRETVQKVIRTDTTKIVPNHVPNPIPQPVKRNTLQVDNVASETTSQVQNSNKRRVTF